MVKLTEEEIEKARDLYREAFVILGDVAKIEITLSRIKNEATEITEKMHIVSAQVNGNET